MMIVTLSPSRKNGQEKRGKNRMIQRHTGSQFRLKFSTGHFSTFAGRAGQINQTLPVGLSGLQESRRRDNPVVAVLTISTVFSLCVLDKRSKVHYNNNSL